MNPDGESNGGKTPSEVFREILSGVAQVERRSPQA